LDELQSIGFLRLTFLITLTDNKPAVPLPEQLGKIDAFRRKVNTAEAKPVMEMNLALADVVAPSLRSGEATKIELRTI